MAKKYRGVSELLYFILNSCCQVCNWIVISAVKTVRTLNETYFSDQELSQHLATQLLKADPLTCPCHQGE